MKPSPGSGTREKYREKKRLQIWEIMLELLDKMPFREITIQKICDAADIHRSTFYNHFYDIYDLLSFGTAQILKDWHVDDTSNFMENNIAETVSDIVTFIEQYRNAIINISETKYKDEILSHTYTSIEKTLHTMLELSSNDSKNEMNKQMLIRFLGGGFEKTLSYWAQNRSLSHEELEQQVRMMVEIVIQVIQM